jgi:hypothetical protein
VTEPSTYGQLHAGDVVLGADGEPWGVWRLWRYEGGQLTIVLMRGEREVTGYPRPDEPVTVVHRCDTSAEAAAWALLAAGGLQPQVIEEHWER